MAKLMRSKCRGFDAGALECMPDERSNAAGSLKAADRCLGAKKHTATGAMRSPALQIRSDRLADFGWQGQPASMATLAAYGQLPSVPINIIELQRRHLT